MPDSRDPHRAERDAARQRRYNEGIAEYHAVLDLDDKRAHFQPAAVAACALCDADGYRPSGCVCDHVDRTETAAVGSAMVRQALAEAQAKRDAS